MKQKYQVAYWEGRHVVLDMLDAMSAQSVPLEDMAEHPPTLFSERSREEFERIVVFNEKENKISLEIDFERASLSGLEWREVWLDIPDAGKPAGKTVLDSLMDIRAMIVRMREWAKKKLKEKVGS